MKLFTPDAQCTWLLTELHPENDTLAFGLCDLGQGYPELAYVSLLEIAQVRGPLGLRVECDRQFVATRTIADYAEEARLQRRIIA